MQPYDPPGIYTQVSVIFRRLYSAKEEILTEHLKCIPLDTQGNLFFQMPNALSITPLVRL
jgi:hypothetical protein